MTDKEQISAFMDNEEMDNAFIESLSQTESAETWKNYHLIGDVMRGETPETQEWDIAANVALALEDEPAHQLNDTVTEFMPSQPTPSSAKKTMPSWLTQFSQVAMAACFSLVVIVGVQQYNGSESNAIPASGDIQVLDTIPFSGTAEPVSLTRDSLVNKTSTEADVMEQRKRINAMLQDYELQLRLNAHDGSIDRDLLEQNTTLAE
ncbi:RseA family anti-sigma factor [Aliivibrio finisterrensis]|uniref:RseA family anti-sigma factor n=1 Tax=Aliivibrio finisterrensis TaxID=511998 RepID=UPI0010213647|nr:RseA family anti-sigma factor [Aliivibrio finisterrensis]RYU58917.1 anti-sigma E factor [Aliivibrio finisterrensis]